MTECLLWIVLNEWFGDNNISATKEQIKELQGAIEIASEMQPVAQGAPSDEIEILKRKLNLMELFIESKGFCISVNVDYIENYGMMIVDGREVSEREVFIGR